MRWDYLPKEVIELIMWLRRQMQLMMAARLQWQFQDYYVERWGPFTPDRDFYGPGFGPFGA